MIGPEILYALRFTIESGSCNGAMAIFVGPWVGGDDTLPRGERP